jgi:c-di-GMP-binding flagellar brake protein YcgR
MATPVGRIEKEFLLNELFEKKIPILYIKDRTEYILTFEQQPTEELVLRPDRSMGKIKNNTKLNLLFEYRGQVVDFNVEVAGQKDELIFCNVPDKLHKNLDRNYVRVDVPSDLNVLFTFLGDRYNLTFPKVSDHENIDSDEIVRTLDSSYLSGLIKQITVSLKKFADEFKIVNFKDKKPEIMEERIVAETGKTLFIPSTSEPLPKVDPYPKKRIITEELFKRYLEGTGVGTTFIDDNITRFLRKKVFAGIYSDAWVPILFHEYVVGYIHVWINTQGRPPFDFNVLDHIYQFSKVLAFSLKENGYFEYGRVKNEAFQGRVLDISASGLLFACPLGSSLLTTLVEDSDFSVCIETPKRSVNVAAKVVRRYKDKSAGYFGCRFINLLPEDMRFLFEYLYGRQIDDKDSALITGQV